MKIAVPFQGESYIDTMTVIRSKIDRKGKSHKTLFLTCQTEMTHMPRITAAIQRVGWFIGLIAKYLIFD